MLARVISRKHCGNLCMPVEEMFSEKRSYEIRFHIEEAFNSLVVCYISRRGYTTLSGSLWGKVRRKAVREIGMEVHR
jgi:hypothetical protein